MIIDRKVMLTEEGLKKDQEELNYLKRVKRKEIAEKIRNAVTFGEIAENAEYNAAKNEQAFIEGRVLALEKIIENYELIDKEENPDCVLLGSEVLIKDMKNKKESKYTIFISALESLFDKYQENGKVRFDYKVKLYLGQLG